MKKTKKIMLEIDERFCELLTITVVGTNNGNTVSVATSAFDIRKIDAIVVDGQGRMMVAHGGEENDD